METLITGASGFVGSALSKRLGNSRSYVYTERLPTVGNLVEQMQGIDVVVHLAGGGGNKLCINHPKQSIQNNILFTKRLVEAAKIANIKQVIFSSTIAVYSTFLERTNPLTEDLIPEPDDLYGAIKWGCEEVIKEVPHTIFRFANIYGYSEGNLQKGGAVNKLCINAAKGLPIKLTSSTLKMDFVHIEDVVDAIARAVLNPKALNQIINVGSGGPITLLEVTDEIQTLKTTEVKVDEQKTYATRWLSIIKAKELLGWMPKITLQVGIKELMEKI